MLHIVNGVTTVYSGNCYEYEVGIGITRIYHGGAAIRVAGASDPAANGFFYLLKDHLGSTSLTVDSSGNMVSETRYKAWGETRYMAGATATTFGYTGQRQEPDLGFYYYKARWYDPALGRFLQADTIVPEAGNPMALDRYGYVVNNPVKLLDPSGHCWGVLKFIRGIPTYETTCNNIDMARLIVRHDDTTSGQKGGAVAYMFWEGISHAGLVVGLAGLACSTVAGCAAAAEKDLGIGIVACADGDCTNEANAARQAINITAKSVIDKLDKYLLNPDHPLGRDKAAWFEKAISYTRQNLYDLAKQIAFDDSVAVQTEITMYGVKYNQVITILGANGKEINVLFAWIRNLDGTVRLVTGIPIE